MGSCLSKKSTHCAAASPSPITLSKPENLTKSESQLEKKKVVEENVVKKEIFLVKHRKSDEIERRQQQQHRSSADGENAGKEKSDVEKGKPIASIDISEGNVVVGVVPVRTSSCTKEEVDAILIQCGRLSRSSSTVKAAPHSSENGGGRKYSGSKRSYDFDGEGGVGAPEVDDVGEAVAKEREDRRSERRSQSHGRRRTPSREREREQQQRSGSRERGGNGGGRRVSRSPGKRSQSPITSGANSNSNSSAAGANAGSRPGKMVSVPATVSSMAVDKNQNAAGVESGASTAGAVKRIQVKRNVSPRARSPARTRGPNEGQNANVGPNQQIMSLSRSNSRKADHSPYRRNPLAEIDTNIVPQASVDKPARNNKNLDPTAQESPRIPSQVSLNAIPSSCPENPKPQPLARSRSSRLSRDLDTIIPETLSLPEKPENNMTSSYTALLLEDIQNFHQKNHHNPPPPPPAFSLPACITKACSILEAVADLNSSTGSNLSSSTPFPDRTDNFKKTRAFEAKDPILESEVAAKDDLLEPSFHKYVTVRRGASEEDAGGREESSGSNNFAAGGSQWNVSSSGWEPNSAESTNRSNSSTSSAERQVGSSELGRVGVEEMAKKKVSSSSGGKKRDSENGIGKGRMGTRNAAI